MNSTYLLVSIESLHVLKISSYKGYFYLFSLYTEVSQINSLLVIPAICPAGLVGTNCNISCSEVIPGADQCRGVVACSTNTCSCMPGFTGTTCDEGTIFE
jgi:hypothetical protein